MLIGKWVDSSWQKMTINNNNEAAEELANLFKIKRKASVKSGKRLANNVMKNRSTALEIGTNIGSAAVCRSPKAASASVPNVKIFLSHRKKTLSWKIQTEIQFHKYFHVYQCVITICSIRTKYKCWKKIGKGKKWYKQLLYFLYYS